MLNVESFRFPQEIELIERLKTHPALAAICTDASGHQYTRLADAEDDIQLLVPETYPDIRQTVADALGLFGRQPQVSLVAVGSDSDTYYEVAFRRDGSCLTVLLPRAALSNMKGVELAAGIGHGLGHLLLGHDADPDLALVLALARAEAVADDEWMAELWDDPVSADLLMHAAMLAILQDLSADRIGLLVAGDLDAAIRAATRSFSDVLTDSLSVRAAMRYVVPTRARPEPAVRPHPPLASRALLFDIFSASALYREAIGQSDGCSVAELTQRCAPFLPMILDADQGRGHANLDDLLLELILMDTVVTFGCRSRPRAARMIPRYVPPGLYDQVIERYDEWSADHCYDTDLLRPWLRRSARKTPLWKISMVERFIYLTSLDHRIDDQVLGEIATLTGAMGAQAECRIIYALRFGYDPFRWLGSERSSSFWEREVRALLV